MILLLTFLLFGINVFAQSARELHTIYEVAGADSGAMLGYYVKGVGDLNKDGFTDVAVSAPGQFKTYIYYGGVPMSPKPTLTLEGGGTIASGDFNGDGWIDLAIEKLIDTVFIYYGSAKMDSTHALILAGEYSQDNFGHIMAVGDVNYDGFDDLIISAPSFPHGESESSKGKIYIYAGNKQIDSLPKEVIIGDTSHVALGYDLVVGDINGDGKKDIVALGYNELNPLGSKHFFYLSIFLGDSAFNLK
ncbi:MAG: FG-GAP and VCBS repeat-containing protein, partial [Ignavibacteriaceae bacterium]|nr:FG-GAP and VCBS repeat-containing protein [Ignavibacteriaceae bacterium]